MKHKLLFVLSFLCISLSHATASSLCRWTSDRGCHDHHIGDFCGQNGECYAYKWTFEEAECTCYEKPDMQINTCNRYSDPECRRRVPGPVRNGYCEVTSVRNQNSPECTFQHHQRVPS